MWIRIDPSKSVPLQLSMLGLGLTFSCNQKNVRVRQEVPEVVLFNAGKSYLSEKVDPYVRASIVEGFTRIHQEIKQEGEIKHGSRPRGYIFHHEHAMRRQPSGLNLLDDGIAFLDREVVHQIEGRDGVESGFSQFDFSNIGANELSVSNSQLPGASDGKRNARPRNIYPNKLAGWFESCEIQGKEPETAA